MTVAEEIMHQLDKLDEAQQQRLLNFARILARTPVVKGESGQSIVAATGFFDRHAAHCRLHDPQNVLVIQELH